MPIDQQETDRKLARLADSIKSEEVAFFFGAGASKGANLPLGEEAVTWLLEALLANYHDRVAVLDKYQKQKNKLRFEKAISTSIEVIGQDALTILDIFEKVVPTLAHDFVAACADSELLAIHLTTNFDNLMDQSFADRGINLNTVCELDDFDNLNIDGKHIFQNIMLHGAARSRLENPSDIIATIDAILNPLPEPKSAVLERILESHQIIFVGYSAYDVDIFPILSAHSGEANYWWISTGVPNDSIAKLLGNNFSNYIDIKADDAFGILSDLVLGSSIQAKTPTSEEFIKDGLVEIVSQFGESVCFQIACELLTLVGMHNEAIAILDRLKSSSPKYYNFKLPQIYYQSGRWNALKRFVPSILDSSDTTSVLDLAALARICHDAELPKEAVELATQAFTKACAGKLPEEITTAGLALGNILLFRGRHQEALEPLEQALKSSGKSPERAAFVEMSLGVLKYRMGDFENAASHYQNALTIFQETTDHFSEAKCHLNFAELYRHNKDHLPRAFQHIKKAKELARTHDFKSVIANLFAIEILTLKLAQRHEQALEVAQEANDFYSHEEDPGETYSNLILNIGTLHFDLGQYDLAHQYYAKALQIYLNKYQPFRAALAESNISQVMTRQGKLEEAEQHLSKGLNHAEKCGQVENRREVTCWLNIAECEISLAKGERDRFIKAFNAARSISNKLGLDEPKEVLGHLKSLAEKDGIDTEIHI